jgi:hypothetical protein
MGSPRPSSSSFGRASKRPVADPEAHALFLLGARRCPLCAEAMVLKGPATTCRKCAAPAFSDAAELARFVSWADRSWLALVPVLALLGLVPLVSALLGLWAYRLSAAGTLAAYGPWQARLSSQFLRAAGIVAVSFLLPIPPVGALLVPLFIGLLHAHARRAVQRTAGALDLRRAGPSAPHDHLVPAA